MTGRLAEGATRAVFARRWLWIVSHEVGHVLGMEHCIYFQCVMNGTNSLEESDEKPLHLCPVCHSKLKWSVGFEDLHRERECAEVLARLGLVDDASWSVERMARLGPMDEIPRTGRPAPGPRDLT